MSQSTTAEASLVTVTRDNSRAVLAGVPALVRRAFALATRIHCGSLIVMVPDGRRFVFKGHKPGPEGTLIIRDYAFARRLALGGGIGFAESYIRGEWDSPDVTAFLEVFSANHEAISTLLGNNPIARVWQNFRHWLNRNTKTGSRRNIHAHYDLGNAFYSKWLDRTMTYSSALFEPHDNDLSSAQTRKYRALAEQIQVGPNDHVLEIGCGWGGFAEFVAKEYGARVTGLTISTEQYKFAKQRVFDAGLADKVDIKLQDYRDETGVYDKIASIEMFEAVGREYWNTYFRQLRDRLRPGGRAGLQVITIREHLFNDYVSEQDFIRRYIFPGGMLPTPTIMKELGATVGVPLIHDRAFGLDYARTLAEWRERFVSAWPSLTPLGFDERFRRIWQYYLHYCEAGFRAGTIDVRQMIFAKQA